MFFDDGEEEGGTFGGGPGGSKLSSLFGMDRANNQGGNESLTYTAPKQPKKNKGNSQDGANSSSGGQSALLLAVAVHAYRFSNGTYIKHGKLGAAILGNHVASDYKILLYISKQQQVTHARITPSFVFTVQANNYATFYDEQRQNWSVMFESEQNAVDFAKQVGLAKLNAGGGATKGVMGQDLVIGMGDPIQTGDSIEVKYTGWLYQNKSFGNIFDSNVGVDKAFRFKIGKGKVIKGWEEGVLGMKKTGRRLLLIPPAKGYGKKGLSSRIPPNSTLIFDVEIKKVKVGKEREDGAVSSDAVESSRSDEREQPPPPRTELCRDNSKSDPPPPPKNVEMEEDLPSMDNLHQERAFDDSVNSRSPNVNEQMASSPSTSKAKLISRMAKMGQPMLPMQGAAVAQDSTDSEADEYSASSDAGRSPSPTHTHPRKPMKVPRKPAAQPIQPVAQQVQPQTPTAESMAQNSAMSQSQHQIAVYQAAPIGAQSQPIPMQQPQQFQGYPQQQMYPQQAGGVAQSQQMVPQQDMYGNAVYPAVSQPMMPPVIHSVHVPMLLSEARQHHTNLQDSVSKVSDKIETLNLKVDKLQINTSNQLNLTHTATSMEAGILMTNIQRIVQENEKLKRELEEKSTKIEAQNEKIADLLQRNQMYVEQSHSILEKRNDSFKQTTAQSQARVLELEQEKVEISTELSHATAKISSFQLEVSALQQKEKQLKIQLAAALSQAQERLSEVDNLKSEHQEIDSKVSELTRQLKDEKLEKKTLSTKFSTMEEELAEAQTERDTLEKAIVERKRKAAADKQRAEEEMEELKKMYEDELNAVKTKLKQQKSSVDVATAEQISQVERELESQWKERSERLLAQAQDKHDRAYNELVEEKDLLSKKLANTEQKMIHLRSCQGDSKEEVEKLNEQLEEMALWKEKYENLHSGAVSMKERYETRIKELMQEKAANAASSPQSNVIDEVKKIMNNVYHTLRNEFDASSNYKGNEILNIIMNTIKAVTMKLMSPSIESDDDASEEEEGSEEEEASEEEEESEEEPAASEEEEGSEEEEESEEEASEDEQEQQSVKQSSDEPASQHEAVVIESAQATSAPSRDNSQQPTVAAVVEDLQIKQEIEEEEEGEKEEEGEVPIARDIKEEEISDQEEQESEPEDSREHSSSEPHLEPAAVDDQPPIVSCTDLPPELPPDLPEVDQQETPHSESNPEEAISKQEAPAKESENQQEDKPAKNSTEEAISSLTSEQDEMDLGSTEDDLPDFSSPVEASEEHDTEVNLPPSEPPPFVPDLPPELPAEDEEKPKRKNTGMEDIFGSDDDDFFTTPSSVKKKEKKEEHPEPPKSAPPKLNNNDEDDLKPKPPPPLFGDDDDDDDLDWLS